MALSLHVGGDAADHHYHVGILHLAGDGRQIDGPAAEDVERERCGVGLGLGKLDGDVIGLALDHREGGRSHAAAEAETSPGGLGLLGDGLAVDAEVVFAAAANGIDHVAGVIGSERSAVAGGEAGEVDSLLPGAVLVGEGGGSGVERQRRGVVGLGDCAAAELGVIEVLRVEACAAVDAGDVVGGDERVREVAALLIDYVSIGGRIADGAEDGLGVGLGGIAVVVAEDHAGVVGVGADHRDGDAVLADGEDVVLVLEQDDGLAGGLLGQLGVGGAAEVVKAEVSPGEHLRRVEHSELEAGAEDAADVHVDLGLGDETLRDGVHQGFVVGTALDVGAGKDSVCRCVGHVGMGVVRTVEVGNCAAVGDHYAVEVPLVAEDVLQQPVAGAAGLTLVAVVCAHHFLNVSVLDYHLERGEVGLPEVAHRDGDVETVAQRLGTAVHGIVLGAGMQLVIFLVGALHGLDGLGAHHGVEVRVLAGSLLSASPSGVAEYVDVRAPEGKALMPDVAVGLGDAEDMVVGGVPDGAGLVGHGGVDLVLLVRVEGGAEGDHLREHRHVVIADAVAGFVPPVVSGDVEAVHGDRSVHHKADLLLGSEQRKEVLNPLVNRQAGVLEGVLVLLPARRKEH